MTLKTIIIIFFSLNVSVVFSQWLPEIRLTNDPAQSYTTAHSRCIGAFGNYVHVVWFDERIGNREIFYKRSTDGGITWSSDIRLTFDPNDSFDPSISVDGNNVYVTWTDERDGNYEIYFKNSSDNGLTWGSDRRVTNNNSISYASSISVLNSYIYIVSQDNRDGNAEIYFNKSTNSGITWIETRLTYNSADSFDPSVSSSSNTISVSWTDRRDGFNGEIYYKRSSDGGITWDDDFRLVNDPAFSGHSSIISLNSYVFIVWDDNRYGANNYDIFFKRSTDSGISWSSDTRLTTHPNLSLYPCVTSSGSRVHVVWEDNRNGKNDIYYINSFDNGQTWLNEIQLTYDQEYSYLPSISVSNSMIHVVFEDDRNINLEIYYKRNPNGSISPPTNPPLLISPPNNSNNISLNPLLDWDSVSNANSYNCQVSIDNNFSSLVLDSSVSTTQIPVPSGRLNNNTQYFWRVRGANSGGYGPWSIVWNFRTLQSLITNPSLFEKWISGEIDTIRWSGTNWNLINIKLTLNFGTPLQSNYTIATGIPSGSQSYIWNIPESFLSFRTKVIIENNLNPSEKIESDIFRLKSYLLTKINPDSTYYEYRKDRDQWGFWNVPEQMWPFSWWIQFNYQFGIDPFTGMPYSLSQGGFTFLKALPWQFPDWVSWVRAFTVNQSYVSLEHAIYSPLALSKWKSRKKSWDGSCFGLAISNALVFRNKSSFYNKFPSFPQFTDPIEIQASDEVRRTVNELFCYQFGQPHINHIIQHGNNTVNQTLRDLKKMLSGENDTVKTLSFYSQDLKGGHAVVAYKLKKDITTQNKYYLYIYDNAYPQSDSVIIIDTNANSGHGTWHYGQQPFNDWGGNKYFFLMDPITKYLSNPIFDDQNQNALSDTILQITNNSSSSLIIKDQYGRFTGHTLDTNLLNIPGSFPLITFNSTRSSPYGYSLNYDLYSVDMTGFLQDTVEIFFFTNNSVYIYERHSAFFSQTDLLSFENGLTAKNIDSTTKNVNLSNIFKETNNEKQIVIRELPLTITDSAKVIGLDSNKQRLVNFGNQKTYNIQLSYSASSGLGEFEAYNLLIPTNSSHLFIPNWSNLYNSQLIILVDIGNNGTIDDTLRVDNQIIGVENEGIVLPREYALNQNYPNPFNGNTFIVFDIVEPQEVKLAIYDILGSEVSTLVNNKLNAGRYKAIWNADNFASGIYFYSIKAGDYTATRKMVLVK